MHTLLKGNVHVGFFFVYLHKEHECIVYCKRYERVSKFVFKQHREISYISISISINSAASKQAKH